MSRAVRESVVLPIAMLDFVVLAFVVQPAIKGPLMHLELDAIDPMKASRRPLEPCDPLLKLVVRS